MSRDCWVHFHVPVSHLYNFFEKKIYVQTFCSFKRSISLLLSCLSSLYILDISPLSLVWFTNTFYHSVSYLITLLRIFFAVQKFFSLKTTFRGAYMFLQASLLAQMVKKLQETQVWSLGWEDPLEKRMATHSSILAWKIPWTEKPGGLQRTIVHGVTKSWMQLSDTQVPSFVATIKNPHLQHSLFKRSYWNYWVPYLSVSSGVL